MSTRALQLPQALNPELQPSNWDVKDWGIVISAVSAAIAWLYRNTIRRCFHFTWNVCTIPSRIERMLENQGRMLVFLEMNKERGRMLMNAQADPMWESDANGECTFANAAMLKVLKRKRDEVLGNSWRSVIYDPDRKMVHDEWDACVRQQRNFELTYRWMDSSGNPVWIHANAQRIPESGPAIGYISRVTVLQGPPDMTITQAVKLP